MLSLWLLSLGVERSKVTELLGRFWKAGATCYFLEICALLVGRNRCFFSVLLLICIFAINYFLDCLLIETLWHVVKLVLKLVLEQIFPYPNIGIESCLHNLSLSHVLMSVTNYSCFPLLFKLIKHSLYASIEFLFIFF